MSDIMFRCDDYIFSYRVGGILLRDNKILQRTQDIDR